MNMDHKPVYGQVKNGVVVLEKPGALPEGMRAVVTPMQLDFTPEEQAEFEAWDRLSDEARAMIDEWEKNGFPDQKPPTPNTPS
jgi:hypothetical protein